MYQLKTTSCNWYFIYEKGTTGGGMRALIPAVGAVFLAILLPVTASAGSATENGQERTWNFAQATIPGAQNAGNWGEGVTVAVVDTWVDFGHPDLKGRISGRGDCIDSATGCREDSETRDQCAHGTHVAGTVVSGRYGVAPRANVLAVQVLAYDPVNNACSGSADDVARGIRFAVGKGVDVINLSLGTQVPGIFSSQPVEAAVHDAANAGVVVIFAAGNTTVPVSDDYGADALLVAATGPDGKIASYSARGGSVSLAAPGGDDGAAGLNSCERENCIFSTVPGRFYALREGTSMAAPHVSGVAALLLSQHPDRGRADVLRALQSTARPLVGARDGLIDATAALRQRTNTTQEQATTTNGATTNGPNRRVTTVRRPPAQSQQEDAAESGQEIIRSRSVTFPRVTDTPTTSDRALAPVPPGQAAPPDARAPTPARAKSALPLKVLWSGLAAVGVIGAVVAAFGAGQRLRRSPRGPW